ncbi:unnamed protein product [Staurois parvus]|uniref:Uncharacterized protein n=1 Tax=Staurois parvus TaxID=386267 RepID=A0ABN9GGJ0_9NEOB|nr:unnamed protein product [Staurois parvus]
MEPPPTAAMGGRTGTHDYTLDLAAALEEAVQGPMTDYGTWQKHEESVRGPMADYGPGSSIWGGTGAHGRVCGAEQRGEDDYQESNRQSGGAEAASIEGHTQS